MAADDFLAICDVIGVPYDYFNDRLDDWKEVVSMNLSNVKTCDLVAELSHREGVEKHTAEPYQDVTVSVNGPAVVLVVID